MTALMYADMVQSAVMVGGASVLAGYGPSLTAVGGVPALFQRFPLSLPPPSRLCPARAQALKLLRPPGGDLPWPGMLLGLGATAGWYWCTDQVIVQRCLAGRSLTHVRGGCVLCGYLKVLPMFLMVLPGMAARLLYPGTAPSPRIIPCNPIESHIIPCNPIWLRGLMLAVVLAALMSSLASILASAGAIFSLDLYGRLRPRATQRRLLVAGSGHQGHKMAAKRPKWLPSDKKWPPSNPGGHQATKNVATKVATKGTKWPPSDPGGQQVTQSGHQGHKMAAKGTQWPPRRPGPPPQGAFWGLAAGLALGLARMVPEFAMGTGTSPCQAGSGSGETGSGETGNLTSSAWMRAVGTGSGFSGTGSSGTGSSAPEPGSVGMESGGTGSGAAWGAGRCPDFLCGLHYLHFAALLFVATCAVAVAVSLCHPPIDRRHVSARPTETLRDT
ncbi:sodium/glucose cotransporter 2-like [Numida meleagris]|uniref:sodium/glucose cotransporter 2-like n=1 Tax=Numida meleagris TaxID=8996 RepID=UPI000B3D93DE|nr:sodium/glucose cotransporter 2-like [Numida meleagris]